MAKKKSEDKNQNGDPALNEADASPSDEEPNFSDPEGFVDDISNEGTIVIPGTHVLLHTKILHFTFNCILIVMLYKHTVKKTQKYLECFVRKAFVLKAYVHYF